MTIEHHSGSVEFNEEAKRPEIRIEPGYDAFIPQDFYDDPIGYFEREGRNIKPGTIEWKEPGKVKEDPTATKSLPDWINGDVILHTIGKRVNTTKSQIGRSGDPFYEYAMMHYVRSRSLPTAIPIARIEQGGTHLIIMERVPGYGFYDPVLESLKEDHHIREQAVHLIDELRQRFEQAGIFRENWSPKDMIFDIDFETRQIRSITPIDWERTKIVPQT